MKRFFTWFRRRWLLSVGIGLSLLALAPDRALALDPGKHLTQYSCQTWRRQNGLPVKAISSLAQTRDGYLWLGSRAGLICFNGSEFKLTDLSRFAQARSSVVTSVAPARNGGLWVGLENGGFGFYDGKKFSQLERESAGINTRTVGEGSDGRPWVANGDALFRRTAGTNEIIAGANVFPTNMPDILCGYEDQQGRFWFGTSGQGVYRWQAGQITKIPDPELDTTTVWSLAEDSQGQIWVGTSSGLFCYDANLRRQTIPTLVEEVRALLVDRQGVLWIGTTGRGVGRFQNGAYEFLQKADGLAGNYVNALAEDAEGSVWIGMRDGVSQLTDVKFPIQQAAEDPLIMDAISVSASARGGVWIGSSAGVTYFDGTAKTYGTEAGLPTRYIKRTFEASNGDLYLVCGNHRLAIFAGEKTIAVHTNSNMFVGMAEDAQGVVVSLAGDLYRVGTNYLQPYIFKDGQKPELWWVNNLMVSRDGAIWAASANGICRVKDGAFQQWTTAQGLTDPRVNWVCEDQDGIIWAGTFSGIARIKDGQLRVLNRNDGLFDDIICAIEADNFGNFWVDSSRGIFRVERQQLNDVADGKIAHVECVAYDGVESVKVADKSVQEWVGCKTADGRIWFPNPTGVVMIDPAHVPMNQVPPPVHIVRVLANGQETQFNQQLVVAPGKGELEIHFDALSFIAPQRIQFRYQLEGYDKSWVEAGNRRMAFYTNLKPGNYTFRVIAANADGVWNTTGDTLRLTLRPHYYQTAWFALLLTVVICAGLAAIYFWRMQHLANKQKALQRARQQLEAEVRARTSELAESNASLQREISGHKQTTTTLEQRTRSLEAEIEERRRMQQENERVQRQLLDTSRAAGMAEVATSVLHNVGNVLNSVNVSASLLAEQLRKSKISGVSRMADLLEKNRGDLAGFLAQPGRVDQIIEYLKMLAQHLDGEQSAMHYEIQQLMANIEHIKKIVAMQQGYAKVSGVTEVVNPADLVEDSLRMNYGGLSRHGVQVQRDFLPVPDVVVDKNKVLQILVNLIRNAKHACDESQQSEKRIILGLAPGEQCVRISVTDNGVGIPPENLTKIFNHGFTTRKNGHGFGLHSSALAAKELGGSLAGFSDGPGAGARFVLELPLQPPQEL